MIFKCFHKLSTNKTRNRAWKQCCHFRDPPVQEMPVQSMITHPSPHDVIAAVKSGCEYTDITQCLIKTQDTTNIVVWPIEPIWESFHILKYQKSWTIFYSLIITSTDDIQAFTIPLIPGRSITVKGIAWGGGGLGIARVDVSADGGEHFTRSASINLTIR